MSTNHDTGERPSWTARLQELEDRIAQLLNERFDLGEFGVDTDLFEKGLDSMARLELLAMLEQRFSVELTEDMTSEFRTPSRIARVVRSALDSSRGRSVS